VLTTTSFRARQVVGFYCLLFVAMSGAIALPVAASETTPGLVREKPEDGPAIATDQGYMVPYTETIPGTEVSFEMVPIPGGKFLMGSPPDEEHREEDEGPQVEIEVPPMWVGKHEVTWQEYKLFMDLCTVFEKLDDLDLRQVKEENELDAITAPSKLYDPSFTFSAGDGPTHPAVSMSQYAAKQYTKWLSLLVDRFYRLPTEAEWEYACRAGTTTVYHFGDDPEELEKYAWYYDNADWETQPVGGKLPNAWGLYDMHGNASEWVLDQYEADWYAQLHSADRPLTAAEALNWPEKLFPRVLRGGSWNVDPEQCRSASRRQSHDDDWRSYDPNVPQSPWWFASDESQDVGFRIVRPLVAPEREEREQFWEADVEVIRRTVERRIDHEGRGKRGLVDDKLPEAIRELAE